MTSLDNGATLLSHEYSGYGYVIPDVFDRISAHKNLICALTYTGRMVGSEALLMYVCWRTYSILFERNNSHTSRLC
jgi:hypothetical protein